MRRKHRKDEFDRYMRARLGLALAHRGAIDAGVHNLVTAVVGGDAALDAVMATLSPAHTAAEASGRDVVQMGTGVESAPASVADGVEVVATAVAAHAMLGAAFLDRAAESDPRTSGPRQAVLRAVAVRHLTAAAGTYDALMLRHGVGDWATSTGADGRSEQQRAAAYRIATDPYVRRRVLDAHFFTGLLHAGPLAADAAAAVAASGGASESVEGAVGTAVYGSSRGSSRSVRGAVLPTAWRLVARADEAGLGPTVVDDCCTSRQRTRSGFRRHARLVKWLGGELCAPRGLFAGGAWSRQSVTSRKDAPLALRGPLLAAVPRTPQRHRAGVRAVFHLQRYLHWVAQATPPHAAKGRGGADDGGGDVADAGAAAAVAMDAGGLYARQRAPLPVPGGADTTSCVDGLCTPLSPDVGAAAVGDAAPARVMGLAEDPRAADDGDDDGSGEHTRVVPTAFDAHLQLGALFNDAATAVRASVGKHSSTQSAKAWTRKAAMAWRHLAQESLRLLAPLTDVLERAAPIHAPLVHTRRVRLTTPERNVTMLDAAAVRHLAAAVALRPTSRAALRLLDEALRHRGATTLPQV